MNRLAFGASCVATGFIGGALLFPGARSANEPTVYHQLDLFSDAFERVRSDYVTPTDDHKLVAYAIEGMVSSLDPHSEYMDAKALAELQSTTRGEFGGLGIEVTMEAGLVKVISPIDGTPAAKAGLKSGDYIAAIDGVPVEGMPLEDASNKMRGPAGTNVTLTVVRSGEKKPFDVTLTRANVQVDNVSWHREGDIGYIRIPGFNERTADGLEHAVKDLKRRIGAALRGYVIDLRNNPGGLFDQSVRVSSDFLNSGEIVSTRGRYPEQTQRVDAKSGGDITGRKPLVVLINAGSASAAEIVAGALQDHKRASIVGMVSFGKGSVQTIIPMRDGALRLTTARYYTPSGRSIQAQGIIPDIAVAQGDENELPKLARLSEADLPGHIAGTAALTKANAPIIRAAPGKKYADFQLAYALDLLKGKVSVSAVTQNAKSVLNGPPPKQE
jgi:carboxyl-terminal processing protease